MSERLRSALRSASGVVFLCSGNMVRSAFAEVYARHRGFPLPVRSAATTFRNDRMLPETAAALRERGVDEDAIARFRPTHLDDVLDELRPEDVVLAMTADHLAAVRRRPDLAGRAFLLPEVLGESGGIPDPVLEGADFRATFRRVSASVDALLALFG